MTGSATRQFAVVTGASTGIGYHLARTFAQNGFDVLVTADESKIEDAARDIESLGAKVYSVQADLTRDEEVERLWRECLRLDARLTPLPSMQASAKGGDFARETDLETEFDIIDLNVRSTVHLAKLVTKQMVGRHEGRILFPPPSPGPCLHRSRRYTELRRRSFWNSPRAFAMNSKTRAYRSLR